MVLRHAAVLSFAILTLATGGPRLAAAEESRRNHRLDWMATRLGLSDDQKDKVRKIHEEYDGKEDPLEHQLWSLYHQEREAVSKVLTPEQREKMPMQVRQQWQRTWDRVAEQLGMDEGQKQKLRKINEEYGPQFRKLAEAAAEGGKPRGEFRKLRHEEFQAVRELLTDEQRTRLPGVLREDFHHLRGVSVRREVMKGLADTLDLSADQKEQVRKIQEDYSGRTKKLAEELRELHRDEHKAMEAVLTDSQRSKLQELHKGRRPERE